MPRESICYTNPGATQTFGIAIQRVSAPGPDPRIDVFAPDVFQLQYAVAEGSINDIAGAPEVLAVAAICRLTNAIQPYSSQGPTIDGRIRPDISGPTNVSTSFAFTAGCSGAFGGTSAASPHVAGAAALYKGALGLAPQGLRDRLEANAVDLGAAGKDSVFGAGRLRLALARCAGRVATIVGTRLADVLRGTNGPDVIAALEGKDRVNALGGKDVVCAGAGNDLLRGGGGNDRLLGQAGRTALRGTRQGPAEGRRRARQGSPSSRRLAITSHRGDTGGDAMKGTAGAGAVSEGVRWPWRRRARSPGRLTATGATRYAAPTGSGAEPLRRRRPLQHRGCGRGRDRDSGRRRRAAARHLRSRRRRTQSASARTSRSAARLASHDR